MILRMMVPLLLLTPPAAAQSLLRAEMQGGAASGMPNVVHPDGVVGGASSQRARNGFFHFQADVNGTPLPMTLDTGASLVALTNEDASRAGVDMGALRYTLKMLTPNGTVDYAPVLLRRLRVGDITRTDVRAAVAPPGKLDANLLGQSFLTRIGGFRQEGDRVLLSGK